MMNMSKKVGIAVVLSALVVTTAIGMNAIRDEWRNGKASAAENGAVTASMHTITVAGKGEILVDPDVAYVTFGIQTSAATAKEAQALNADKFVKLEDVLYNKYQLSKKDVKTTNFTVRPEYKYEQNKAPELTGYQVVNMVQVTYRELDKIGVLLDAVSEAGVNQVNGIQFDTEKTEQYELQALELAMANAKAKAQAMAKTENRTVKGVLNVVQGNVQQNPITPYTGAFRNEAAMADMVSSTSISGGQLSVSTSVTVQYEF